MRYILTPPAGARQAEYAGVAVPAAGMLLRDDAEPAWFGPELDYLRDAQNLAGWQLVALAAEDAVPEGAFEFTPDTEAE